MKSRNPYQSSNALIVILPIIAILTLIILTVLSMALFDSHLATNNLEQARAGSFVKYAIDDVADKLYQIPLDRHWAAGPGHIRYWDGSSSWSNIELYSGTNGATPFAASDYQDGATATTAAKCVQLNVPLADGSYSIMSTNSEYGTTAPNMTVKWIYVLQNGTTVTDPTLLPNQGVVGRYGYWTDVENGRVNINTAGFGMVNSPTGRFQWNVENWWATWATPNVFWPGIATLGNYGANVLTPNPWMADRMVAGSTTPITFTNSTYPTLLRGTAQTNSIQNLTAHPSSIDLSFLDYPSGVTTAQKVQKSFDTFRYAGSYFLRVDALNSCSYFSGPPNGNAYTNTIAAISPTPNPDVSVRFFKDPSDWQLIVDTPTYQRNKGYITVKGRSPEITPWGLPKTALTLDAHDGLALNDLTEVYSRTIQRLGVDQKWTTNANSQDSRQTQVPFLYPIFSNYWPGGDAHHTSPYDIPPLPLIQYTRSNFRDLSSADTAYDTNIPLVAALINDLKNLLNEPVPGFGTSLGAKYATYGTNGGENEQIVVELFTFLDSCLNNNSTAFACYSTASVDYSGRGVPMAAASPSAPPATNGSIHRQGSSGSYLVNEIALEAGVLPYSSVSGLLALQQQPAPPSVATSLATPAGYLSAAGSVPAELFLLRQPTDDPTPDGNSPDMFIKLAMRAESIAPPHWGYTPPLSGENVYNAFNEGEMTNTVIQYSTNGGATWSAAIAYDMDTSPKFVPSGYWSNLNANSGVQQAVTPFPWGVPGGPSLTGPPSEMNRSQGQGIYIGPFTAGQVVSLKVSTQFVFEGGYLWEIIPGIFPDVTQLGQPPSSIYNTFLEYDFTGANALTILPNVPDVIVSYEATDPRVTRHKTDWTLSTNPFGNSLNAVNATVAAAHDDSKLARPPAFISFTRSLLGMAAVTTPNNPSVPVTPETSTASKILCLPGVGYLSEVPTGADSGIPWQTMKFHSNSDNPPDWLLWNLFYVPFDRSIMNQTDGKLNINARLYPFQTAGGAPLVREKPLEALLGNRVSNPTTLATAIANGPTYTNGGALPSDLYVYAGQICQVPGFADGTTGSNEFDEEYLARDLADIVTTQSSDYRVFVVTQTLRQSSTGQITPISTQRVEATLSRDVDAGPGGLTLSNYDSPTLPFYAYYRKDYRPTASGPPASLATLTSKRADVIGQGGDPTHPLGCSPVGTDHTPNGPNNWLVPQKIEISGYKIIK